tara:strand:- start:188 stop:694 length:507 start_codon:yes stop_codon:yes gene_type:complete
MLITYVDLAKIKNVSKSAVSQRKAKGIFKQALVKTEDGKDFLDKDLALKAWDGVFVAVNEVKDTKQELKQKIDSLPADSIPDFAESKAKREFYLAELAKLDVEEKKKQLVSVEDIKKSSFATGRAIRESLTNLADRLSHQLAGEDDASVIYEIISSEHREALQNLAQL